MSRGGQLFESWCKKNCLTISLSRSSLIHCFSHTLISCQVAPDMVLCRRPTPASLHRHNTRAHTREASLCNETTCAVVRRQASRAYNIAFADHYLLREERERSLDESDRRDRVYRSQLLSVARGVSIASDTRSITCECELSHTQHIQTSTRRAVAVAAAADHCCCLDCCCCHYQSRHTFLSFSSSDFQVASHDASLCSYLFTRRSHLLFQVRRGNETACS